METRWQEHMTTFGEHLRQGLSGQLPFPRMTAAGMRVDAFPEQGPPGSDLALMRRQHLDANGVAVGMLMPLSKSGMEERNLDYAAALSHAVNEWQLETWIRPSATGATGRSTRRRSVPTARSRFTCRASAAATPAPARATPRITFKSTTR